MPYSKDQRTAARIALAAKRDPKKKKYLMGASLSMYNSMSLSQLRDFAHGRIKK